MKGSIPAGDRSRRTPPVFLKEWDVVEVTIDKIGTLRNVVKRTSLRPSDSLYAGQMSQETIELARWMHGRGSGSEQRPVAQMFTFWAKIIA
ncbi:hypothetical protein FHX10_002578 [Rhizobium sp. BK591]|nr:hypothetical protein [Rhizobium sp. BK591]